MLIALAILPNGTKDKKQGLTHLILSWKPGTIMIGFSCPFMGLTCMIHIQSINI